MSIQPEKIYGVFLNSTETDQKMGVHTFQFYPSLAFYKIHVHEEE